MTAILVAVVMLLFSGNSLGSPVGAGGSGAGSLAGAPSAPLVSSLGGAGATYVGPAAKFLVGPYLTQPEVLTPEQAANMRLPSSEANALPPVVNPRPGTTTQGRLRAAPSDPVLPFPVVSCSPMGPGCDRITTNPGGAVTNPYGINAVDSTSLYGITVEPPDQGLCAGNGYVMEVLNIGELRVYNANLSPESSVIALDSLMGLTQLGYSSGGDISCLYDWDNGGHWFITEFVSTTPESIGGVFAGCFSAVFDTCREGIAVSVTNNPLGAYNVYFLDPNLVNNDPGAGYLLNDFAKIGNTRDALLLSYDEFNLNAATIPSCPAYGCFGFNGAQQFAINKKALELGYPVFSLNGAPDPEFTVAYVNMGTDPNIQPPDGNCYQNGITCWYQVIPAQSPDPAQFDNHYGGSGFMLAGLDFFGNGDNRLATFYWTHLSDLNSANCARCQGAGGIQFGGQIFTGLESYRDEGAACLASLGGFCGLGPQKAGPIPLGKNCVVFGLNETGVKVKSCPENGIATNFDGVTQVSYAGGEIWAGLSTLINQSYGPGNCQSGGDDCELHVGVAYFAIGTSTFNQVGFFALTTQGYITAEHEDLEFPAIAAGDTAAQGAVISFTLSGNGGPMKTHDGGFFPSSAFGRLSLMSPGLMGSVIHITALGMGTQDGFTEYFGYPGITRPRWGDYGWAIFVPGPNGGRFYFASEYIQYPNCSPAAFLIDPSCGGTRTAYANWGSSLNYVMA